MKRKILLAAVLLASSFSFAQKFENRASFWIKPDKTQNSKQTLNKNASINGNVKQSLTTEIGSGNSNFYVVFKSEDGVEKDLLNFTFTCYQHTVTTHNINYNDPKTIDQKRRTGAIVKYGFNYPNASGDKNFVTVSDKQNDLTDVYEVIYVNDAFTDLDHQQVQTYLSLKYGISLINDGNYVDANGTSIWNNQLNKTYNQFITGVGRSDYFGLNKLQTSNSVDKRLEISSNGFANNEYLLIGTNNEKQSFTNTNDAEILDASWLVQTNAKANLSTLKFNLDNLKSTGVYELVLNASSNFENATNNTRFQGKVEGNQLVFENVMFDADGSGSDTFTISYATKAKETTKPEIVNKTEVNAYPNPTNINENVTVAYNFAKPTNLNIHVFTVDGKFIKKQEVTNSTSYQFETSFSASGVYLIVSTYDGQVTTSRIVVK